MIVVAGGSGLLGTRLVGDLLAGDHPVRVLVRDAGRARDVLGSGPEVVEVDVRRPDGLVGALTGATVVVSAFHGLLGGRGAGPVEVDVQGNALLTEAAHTVGASVVLLSALGAAEESKAELLRAKHGAEQALRASGVPWTIVRPGPFIETWVRVLRESSGASGRPLVLGKGDRPISFVSVGEVSAVVLRAATDPDERGVAMEIGGQPVSLFELAQVVQAVDGRPGEPRRLPRAVLGLAGTMARPFSPVFARLSRMALLMDTQDLGLGDPGLRERLGMPPAPSLRDVLIGPAGQLAP